MPSTGHPGRLNTSSKHADELQQLFVLIPCQSTRTERKQLNVPRSKFHDVAAYQTLGDCLLPTLAAAHHVDGPRHKEDVFWKNAGYC